MKSIGILLFLSTLRLAPGLAQSGHETMPSSILPDQAWWNVIRYSITIRPDYLAKMLTGSNTIEFRALEPGKDMSLDLLAPMSIRTVTSDGKPLSVDQRADSWRIHFPRVIRQGELVSIDVAFEGRPKETLHAPWEGGWVWARDSLGRPWMSLADESPGAALWLPCKNAGYDEPDSGVILSITVPDTLAGVGNGRLVRKVAEPGGLTTWVWSVTNPINNYDICPYIGKYVTWHHDYSGLKGNLDCDYWVLDYNREKAERHFRDVDTLLNCFEYWMGPYPFYEDSYKVVEAPHPGMEHQSGIAYGNGFEDGYRGKNLSGTPWGLRWDFILVHESGHEWFGNSISANSWQHDWIHEGFTKYLETLYTTWLFGTEAGNEYTLGIWKRIKNDQPIIASGSSDQYNKGSAMLHMIRQIVGDSLFRVCLHNLNKEFYHSTVSTHQILASLSRTTGRDLSKIFAQYLTTTKVPELQYRISADTLAYRWANCVPGFDMPVKIRIADDPAFFLKPTTAWQRHHLPKRNAVHADSAASPPILQIDSNFYVTGKQGE
jgi:aminopeptidase N